MKKEFIIPIFVPHLECQNDCIFCNQKLISGQNKNITKKEVKKTIEYFLENIKEKDAKKQIAFFGGSFTSIDIEKQDELLQTAYEYIEKGQVDSIRITTRPDYIDKETLKRLKKYKVKTIELGVQSANDYVLGRANRGHTFKDVQKASKLIRWYGFELGHQIMVGLPESNRNDEIKTAKALIKLKPKTVRIYPVLVIKGTKLEKEYNEGIYQPLTLVQAVEISKQLVRMFTNKKIDVIKVGLQNSEEIYDIEMQSSKIVAGPYNPEFRQLVESGMWYDAILGKIKKMNVKVQEVKVTVNPIDVNNVIGHKKENIIKLKETYQVDLVIKKDENIKQGKSKIEITKKYNDFLDENQEVKEKIKSK